MFDIMEFCLANLAFICGGLIAYNLVESIDFYKMLARTMMILTGIVNIMFGVLIVPDIIVPASGIGLILGGILG